MLAAVVNAHSPSFLQSQVLGLEWLDGLEDGSSDEFDMTLVSADLHSTDDLMVPGSVCEVDLLYNSEFMVPEFISNEQSVSQGSSWHSLYQREALEDTAMESFMLQEEVGCSTEDSTLSPASPYLPSMAAAAAGLSSPLTIFDQPIAVVCAPQFAVPAPLVRVSSLQAAANRSQCLLRYREKRRSRKFEKTVRYASRKAYAEVRPRVKGRFAKKDAWGQEYEGALQPSVQ
ncbi:MAG: hypothetical protein WDW38_009612 [Sanguina aurantia]